MDPGGWRECGGVGGLKWCGVQGCGRVEGVRGSRRCRGGGVQFYRLKFLPDSNCIFIKFKMLIHYPKNLSGPITTIMHYNWNTDHHSALQLIQFIAIVEFGQRGQQHSYCPMRYYFLNEHVFSDV